MATHQLQMGPRRQRLRRTASRCSHSTRLDLPILQLGSNMSLQLKHERNGILLQYAHSSSCTDRSRILRALNYGDSDLSKAQACGHSNQLTANLAESLFHHLLFAKAQLPEPVSLLQKKRELANTRNIDPARQRPRTNSARMRKQDKLLRKLEQLRNHLEQAAKHLAQYADNNGEGPSCRPYTAPQQTITSKDVRLLIVMGASATMPREIFVLDLIQAVGRCTTTEDAVQSLGDLEALDPPARSQHELATDELESQLPDLVARISSRDRNTARNKTSTNWERKLVRMLVSDERLEPFLGSPLAPTKMHLFLSAPTSFRCPGWSARHHLDFDLDRLCEAGSAIDFDAPASSADTSFSYPKSSGVQSLKRAPSSPLHEQVRRWSKSACESCSSVAESWPEDSASDHLAESSISSVSDDSRPPSVADKVWHLGGAASVADGWLPRCSSPLATLPHPHAHGVHGVEASRTGSSLGSSTVYGHDSNDAVSDSPQGMSHGCSDADGQDDGTVEQMDGMTSYSTGRAHDVGRGVHRRSREPKAGGLLSRNLLKGNRSRQHSYAGSDSSSVRSAASALKRAPRCAGLQIDFTDPEQLAAARVALEDGSTKAEEPKVERCWFQCEAVLEGFR